MNIKRNLIQICLLATVLLALPAAAQAQDYTYTTNNDGSLNITGASNVTSYSTLIIPNYINGLPVTSIGTNAFQGYNIASVAIGTNVTRIGDHAFTFALMTNITISSSVTSIGFSVFGDCWDLMTITVDTNNLVFSSVSGVLFDKNQTTIVTYPDGRFGSYTIPAGVTIIGTNAFELCDGLTSVTIPDGVANIEFVAFFGCHLTNVTFPNSITNIEDSAFNICPRLIGAYFLGNAPSGDSTVFSGNTNGIVYYLPGTTGWGVMFGGLPTVLWNPQAKTGDGSFGVLSNQFGFNITGSSNLVIVVEASTNLVNSSWIPVATNTLTGGSSYFSDRAWTNYPSRFYRLRSP